MKRWIKPTACLLAALMMTSPAMALSKNEVVYANLESNGSVAGVYVVNRFEMAAAGVITDYGAYSQVLNLTDLNPVVLSGDVVTVSAPQGTFYYQGDLASARLPWDFSLTYFLDGGQVTAQELAGACGRVRMEIAVRQVGGADQVFLDHYTLQMSLTLDGEKCKNIVAPGATLANSGKNRLLTWMVLSGEEKDFSVEMDAEEFAMSALSINGVPLRLDVDGAVDTTDMKDQVSKLQDGIEELDDGAGELSAAAKKLQKGASSLKDGSGQVTSGIAQIKSGSSLLAQSCGKVAQQLSQLLQGIEKLKGATAQIQSGGEALQSGAKSLSQGAGKIKDGLSQIKTLAGTAGAALETLSQAAGSCDSEIALLKTLMAKGQQNADVRAYLGSELKALGKVLATLEGLESGLAQLSAQYAQFVSALDEAATAAASLEKGASQLAQGVADYTGPVLQLAGAVNSVDTSGADKLAQFAAGVEQLDTAIGQLQERYKALDAGIQKLDSGAGALHGGTKELTDGTGELKDETGDLDQKVDDEVDKALDKFRTEGFDPVSFVDERNQVDLVQFVIRTEAIEAPEAEQEADAADATPKTFQKKLAALFAGWGDRG